MREVAVARADPGPDSPVYQVTVFAGVPATCDVAVPSGEPATRSGGNVADGGVLKPSAANAAAFVVVTFRLDPALLRNVIAPPLTVDGTVVPVMASIFPSKVPTVSVTSMLMGTTPGAVVPVFTKLITVPLTVMVLPGAKLAASESEAALPDNCVAPVIAAGGDAWLVTPPPDTVAAELKKSLPAAIADAATSDVLASVPIAVVSAAFRLAAVAAGVAPMAKLPAGGGVALEAVS